MLSRFLIRDFALVEEVELVLAPGLNVLTGETGAGKSILIDALGLVLGRRADPSDVRSGAKMAFIEAVFDVTTASPLMDSIFDKYGIEPDESLSVSREVLGEGRSIARINGRSVPVRALAELGAVLVDVHGQSDHQSLFQRSRQLEYLDQFAGLLSRRNSVAQLSREFRAVRREMGSLERDEREVAREIDRLSFQVEEIDSAKLQDGEAEALRDERSLLGNADRLQVLARTAAAKLQAEDISMTEDVFGVAREIIEEITSMDGNVSGFAQQAAALQELSSDLALALRAYAERIEADPNRLQYVDERLNMIGMLMQKYGDTSDAVIAYGEKARARLLTIRRSDTRLEELRGREDEMAIELARQAEDLSEQRRQAAGTLATAVIEQLADLNMPSTEFETRLERNPDPDGLTLDANVSPVQFDESGVDVGDFLLSVNPGQPLRKLAEVASEGERSRILLGLKVVLADVDDTATLVFDEIDVGVGSRAGDIVGQKLAVLAISHQVLCITHLAPVAAFADDHFVVEKSDVNGESRSRVLRLEGSAVVDEISAMSGTSTTAGRRVARDLLSSARSWKLAHRSA
jgi:DNA repair protein RecN (Recombination protein N)